MSEEVNGTTDAGAETTAIAQPTSFIGEDGTFTEGWRDNYVPEEVRQDAVFDRVKTIQGMAKSLASAERMVGADKMVKPNDKFGDKDWDSYYRAGGWTGEAIPITEPEGLPEGVWSEDRAKSFSEVFNVLRLSPKQQAGIMEAFNADIANQITNRNNNAETALVELNDALLTEKGNAFAQFKHNGNFAIEKGTAGEPPEFKERIVEKYGADPDLVRLLGNLGGKFNEAGSIPETNMAPTPSDIDAKIQEIYNSDAFSKPLHPEHKQAMANLARLHKEKAQATSQG
jgi:hypothetical protein